MARLRILVISNLCPPDFDGGLEMSALEMATALRGRGHDVAMVTSAYRDTFRGIRSNLEWVHRILEYVPHGERGISKLSRFLKVQSKSLENAARVRHFAQNRAVDIGYLFGLHRIGLACHVPLVESGIPVVWHVGDRFLLNQLVLWPRQSLPYRFLLNSVFRKTRAMELRGDYSRIVFVSSALRDEYASGGLTPRVSAVIPRGVSFPIAADAERPRADPPLFYIASRMHRQKGIHKAIEAAALLQRDHPTLRWSMQIAGPPEQPEYVHALQRQIETAGLQSRVELLGQIAREESLAKVRDATAVLSPSIYEEPFGRTILEALASGTPLIASRVGAINELVEDGKSALLYYKGDVARLASHMASLLTEPNLGLRLASEGIRTVQSRFTMDRVLDQVEDLFASVLARREDANCASA